MPTFSENRRVEDCLKHLYHPSFCLVSGTFRNNSGALIEAVDLVGQPVKLSSGKYVPVLAGDEANVGGLVVQQGSIVSLANNADHDVPVAVLVRGPAVISRDGLPATDVAGDALTIATLITALAALDIREIDESFETTTQAT